MWSSYKRHFIERAFKSVMIFGALMFVISMTFAHLAGSIPTF